VGVFEAEKLKAQGCKQIMSVQFDDLTDKHKDISVGLGYGKYRKSRLFQDTQACMIINFLKEVKDKVTILVVQCSAGISRSGAVGLFACRHLGLDEGKFREFNKNIGPNFYVLGVLNEASGLNNEYVQWWESKAEDYRKRVKVEDIF